LLIYKALEEMRLSTPKDDVVTRVTFL